MFKRKEGRIVKKLLALLVLCTMLVGGVVGCGGDKGKDTKKDTGTGTKPAG
jgi:hypothetical protein